MDVIELSSFLKAIGFRLQSIDYDESRCWSKSIDQNGNSASTSEANSIPSNDHFINVQISCTKSKIVSNLSLKLGDGDTDVVANAQQPTADLSKTISCSCATPLSAMDQSSDTFPNQRHSLMVSLETN